MPVDGIDFEFSASTLNAINEYATFKVVKVNFKFFFYNMESI